MSGWTDSHTHLETFARKDELEEVLDRAGQAGVERLVTIGTSPKDWSLYRSLAERYPARITFTAGLHPCDVDADWEASLEELQQFLRGGARPVAVGETGLDRFHLPKEPERAAELFGQQRAAFEAQIAIASAEALPLVVHSRGAFHECLEVIDSSGFDWSRVVFHCFSEGVDEVRALNRRGGWASFTGIVTYRSAQNVREALRDQGAARLMVETDAPYLAPVPHRGKRNEPAYLVNTGMEAARVLGMDPAELAEVTTANAVTFFGLEL